ncbi:hypothetical protein [Streptomyces sp. RKAG293]|uniref:hypothetical protein n=1 Tax=Streptomyces sp. RKAG293 TaxID=2893403 RepID=UPI0020333428|nr:hypothetical protein [Streptomyces sp. RKAG293]MCM2424232.1 hypothetical protein [Streptomyces sp. RKAG293]
MTLSEQQPSTTTLGPIVDGLGPRNYEFVAYLRLVYDRNKARGHFTGLRELQERSTATMHLTVPVISRILSGARFAYYSETCHLWELFTGKPATRKLENLWRRAAAERGNPKKDIDGQIRKMSEKTTGLMPCIVGGRVRIIGSATGSRRTPAIIMATASAILVIVAFVIRQPWIAGVAGAQVVATATLLGWMIRAQRLSDVIATGVAGLRLLVDYFLAGLWLLVDYFLGGGGERPLRYRRSERHLQNRNRDDAD